MVIKFCVNCVPNLLKFYTNKFSESFFGKTTNENCTIQKSNSKRSLELVD